MDTIEILRQRCLERGASGIRCLARTFRNTDDDRSKSLSLEEFRKGIRDFGFSEETFPEEDIRELFSTFDVNNNGTISFDEFLIQLRPPMTDRRVDLVKRAFGKLDQNRQGFFTVADIEKIYDVTKNPKYLSGELTKVQVLRQFLDQFHLDKDETVTLQEFIDYYSGISASVDQDIYFDFMIRQAWKL